MIFYQNSNAVKTVWMLSKISQIGPWLSGIDWCEGHWCSWTDMVVRLSDVRTKTGKNAFFGFLGCFCPYVRQLHNYVGWATSILLTQGLICEIFAKKFRELAILKYQPFWIYLFQKKNCVNLMKINQYLCGRMDGSKGLDHFGCG